MIFINVKHVNIVHYKY